MSWKKTKTNPHDPRALLDELMGADRNFSAQEKERLGPTWRDHGVCKRFLAGCCPAELFATSNHYKIGTRVIIEAACTLKHSQTLKEQFLASGAPEVAQYQRELLPYLERLCTDADQEVGKALQRVTAANQLNEVPPRIRKLKEEQVELQTRAKALLQQAETAGNEGDADTAATCASEAEALQRRIHALEGQIDSEKANPKTADGAMMQTVCAVCGSINTIVDDTDEKHLQGNRHLTWAEIRRAAAELRAKVGASAATGGGGGSGAPSSRDGGRSASADRDRERGKSSDRDREKSRDRDRERERGGGRDDRGERRRDRSRERSRSRDRDRERRRERERSRDRSRERERSGRGGGDDHRGRDDGGRSRRRSRSRDRSRERSGRGGGEGDRDRRR